MKIIFLGGGSKLLQSELYERYPRPLIDLLHLDDNPYNQDWEYCVSDEKRVEEFLNFYQSMPLDNHDKMSLMMIILDSYNQRVCDRGSHDCALWRFISKLIKQDLRFYKEQVLYWSSVNYSDYEIEDAWAIAFEMRKLLIELHKSSNLLLEDYDDWCEDLRRFVFEDKNL